MRPWIEKHGVLVATATEGTAILGLGVLTSSGEVLLNYVSPDARFRGVSKGVAACLEVRARELGVRTVTLQSSTTAREFYVSAGYHGARPSTNALGITLCHPMAKHLV
ncbi:MAG: GNAT family N-acetyltransferase [Hyphomicrobiaceae bacterium]|nr:GNAT family N-acetyltransferase [Hyphomicrobiaceae bacterium]